LESNRNGFEGCSWCNFFFSSIKFTINMYRVVCTQFVLSTIQKAKNKK